MRFTRRRVREVSPSRFAEGGVHPEANETRFVIECSCSNLRFSLMRSRSYLRFRSMEFVFSIALQTSQNQF